jgi:hypothetical protein
MKLSTALINTLKTSVAFSALTGTTLVIADPVTNSDDLAGKEIHESPSPTSTPKPITHDYCPPCGRG